MHCVSCECCEAGPWACLGLHGGGRRSRASRSCPRPTLLLFLFCVSCQAIKEQPAINAVIDGDEIVYRDYVDISIAVSSPKGLVVPVSC